MNGNNQQNTQNTIQLKSEDLNLPDGPRNIGEAQTGAILGTVYFIAGIVAVIVIIIGGLRYITSNGDASGIQSAKNTILYAVVGLVVIIAAAGITGFVLSNVK